MQYSKADDWQPYVVTDGNLITEQNPASSEAAAKAVLEQVSAGHSPDKGVTYRTMPENCESMTTLRFSMAPNGLTST